MLGCFKCKAKNILLSSNGNLFQFLKRNWRYTFLIYVQAFWCTTKDVRQQDTCIIITVNLILHKPLICSWKPSFSFSQDSYWAALWWNLFTSIGFPRNLKLSLKLKNNIFCQHQHRKPFKVLFIFMSDFEKNTVARMLSYLLFLRKNFPVYTFKNKIHFCNPNKLVLGM